MKIRTRRRAFLISSTAVAVLTTMQSEETFSDLWMHELCDPIREMEDAAREMIEQMDDQWCPAYLMALHKEIERRIKDHDMEFGTKFFEELKRE